MMRKETNFTPDLTIEDNIITIYTMNHPANVSNFMRKIYYGSKNGYKDFAIRFYCNKSIFPNVCAPLAGLFEYYKGLGINFSFTFNGENAGYLQKAAIGEPHKVTDNKDILERTPFDVVWKFNDYVEVSDLVDAFVKGVEQQVVCKSGVLDGLTWCLNEVMDNVINHSGAKYGYVMGQLHKTAKHLAFCIFDSGRGIYNSLKESKYKPQLPLDAITLAIKEGVTNGVGQGNGMWGLHNIVFDNSGILTINVRFGFLYDECKTGEDFY